MAVKLILDAVRRVAEMDMHVTLSGLRQGRIEPLCVHALRGFDPAIASPHKPPTVGVVGQAVSQE